MTLFNARSMRKAGIPLGAFLFSAAVSAADGAFDSTFGSGGRETFAIDGSGIDIVSVVRELGDGRLLLGGRCVSLSYACLARLEPDGSLDPSYGPLGLGYARFDQFSSSLQDTSVVDMVVLSDGRTAVLSCGYHGYGSIFMVLADGTGLDTSVGNGTGTIAGVTGSLDNGGCPSRIRQQSDGKFVVSATGVVSGYGTAMTVERFAEDLSGPDSAFGTNGATAVAFGLYGASGNEDESFGLAIQSDGKIIVGGISQLPSNYFTIAVARLLSTGQRDNSFGPSGDGRFHYTEGDSAQSELNDLAVDAQQRIVFGGYLVQPSGFYQLVGRLTNDGLLDTTFNGGITTLQFAGGGQVTSLAATSDSIIALADVPRTVGSGAAYFEVTRLDLSGHPVPGFGGLGSSYASFAADDDTDSPNAVLVTRRGIVIAGGSDTAATEKFGIARLQYEHIFGNSFE